MKLFLAVAVVLLGGAILWVGSGAVGPFVSSMVRGFGSFVAEVGVAVGSPAPTAGPAVAAAPSITKPDEPVTNDESVDVTVIVPAAVTGIDGYSVRLYATVGKAKPAVVAEVPVGSLSLQVIPDVGLSDGPNGIQASIVGPGGESELSEIVTWTLDRSKPKVTVTSPKNRAQVTKDKVTIKGKSQALSAIRLQNDANGATATDTADKNGLWSAAMTIAKGVNVITVTATDPAGNENTTKVEIRRGQGKLKVSLLGSRYSFSTSKLPRAVTFTATVTGSDGRRLSGASALFTVSIPGLQAIVSGEITTNADGVASFKTTVPAGAMRGSGLATVLVTAPGGGSATDRAALTVQ